MRQILQIITRPLEPDLAELLAAQNQLPNLDIHRIDLSQPNPNYELVLDKIFDSDCVQCF